MVCMGEKRIKYLSFFRSITYRNNNIFICWVNMSLKFLKEKKKELIHTNPAEVEKALRTVGKYTFK